MNRTKFSAIILCLALTLVSGCANIQDDSTRTRTEGAGTGAAVGAAAGALFGQLLGGDTQSTLLGAAIGGAVGGIGGYAYGDHVAKQKEKFASEEDWLEACIAEAKKKNSEIVAYNEDLGKQIAGLRKETAALKQQYADVEKRKAKLDDKKKEVAKLLEAANKELDGAKAELDAQNSVVADAKQNGKNDYAKTLDSEIAALKENIKVLETRTEELASMSASMAV